MQRHPTPWNVPNRDGQFICHDDVLVLFANDSSAPTDLPDLLLLNDNKHDACTAKKERDKNVNKATGGPKS